MPEKQYRDQIDGYSKKVEQIGHMRSRCCACLAMSSKYVSGKKSGWGRLSD